MNNRNIFSKQNLVDGMLLRGVEPRESQWSKGEFLGLALVIEQVAQLCKAVTLGFCHTIEGAEHELIGVFIHRQLHSHAFIGLEFGHDIGIGHYYHHAVVLGVAHCA